MANKLKTNIIEHLKKKGNYEPDVDDYTIDLLLQNIDYAYTLQKIIEKEGLIVTMTNGNGFDTTKENPAFGTYMKCLDSIHQTASKLGIHRKERIALKLFEEKLKDEFGKDFD